MVAVERGNLVADFGDDVGEIDGFRRLVPQGFHPSGDGRAMRRAAVEHGGQCRKAMEEQGGVEARFGSAVDGGVGEARRGVRAGEVDVAEFDRIGRQFARGQVCHGGGEGAHGLEERARREFMSGAGQLRQGRAIRGFGGVENGSVVFQGLENRADAVMGYGGLGAGILEEGVHGVVVFLEFLVEEAERDGALDGALEGAENMGAAAEGFEFDELVVAEPAGGIGGGIRGEQAAGGEGGARGGNDGQVGEFGHGGSHGVAGCHEDSLDAGMAGGLDGREPGDGVGGEFQDQAVGGLVFEEITEQGERAGDLDVVAPVGERRGHAGEVGGV